MAQNGDPPVNNELAASLVEIAYQYRNSGRAIPSHLLADLSDVARADSIAYRLRNEASRLLLHADGAA